MPDYNKGVIYGIVKIDGVDKFLYIGSSCNIKHRIIKHKSAYYNENNPLHKIPLYDYIRDNGGFENFDFIIIENYPCNSKQELLIRERYYIEKLKETLLNKEIPSRSRKEWHEDNKERMKENIKKYNLENPDYQKQYRQKNKDKIDEYEKQRSEKRREKFTCECGSICSIGCKYSHIKTLKHTTFILSQTKI